MKCYCFNCKKETKVQDMELKEGGKYNRWIGNCSVCGREICRVFLPEKKKGKIPTQAIPTELSFNRNVTS